MEHSHCRSNQQNLRKETMTSERLITDSMNILHCFKSMIVFQKIPDGSRTGLKLNVSSAASSSADHQR